MGTSMDQIIGLTEKAVNLVYEEGYERVNRFRKNGELIYSETNRCKVPRGHKIECGTFTGMFGDKYTLYQYKLPDGTIYKEDVQSDPWTNKPGFFLALKDESDNWVPESLWNESEMELMCEP